MSSVQLRVVGAGISFLFIFLSGIWLSRSGKPLNNTVLTIHKLISLTTAVFLVIIIYQTNQVATLGATGLVAVVVTGLLFLGTGVSGGLLSTDQPKPAGILVMHRITPFLTLFSTAVTLYLLFSRK